MKHRNTVLLAGLLLAWSATAQAQPVIELGVFAGHGVVSEDSELGNALYDDNVPASGALVGLRVGVALSQILAGEVEAKLMPTEYRRGGESATILGWRASALAHLPLMGGRLRPFALVGFGAESLLEGKEGGDSGDVAEADTDTALHLGLGAKFRVSQRVGVRLDLRYLNVPSREAGATTFGFETHLGVSFALGASPLDADGDGTPDATDQCPGEKEDRDGYRDDDGCPDRDNDGDGIPDTADKCPDEAEDRDGHEDADGCPDKDNDRDGLPDATDKCPNEPEDKDGHQDADGCPDRDNDGDGVPDKQDKCPNKPENLNGWQDRDGCPDTLPEKVRKRFTGRLEGIFFLKNSAVILPPSYPVLNEALKVLKKYPLLRIEISGHTDPSGEYEANVQLSTARAKSVKRWFEEGGIAPTRMIARGYGPDRPLYDNKTPDGRSMNRRIEIHLLKASNGVERQRPATEPGGAKPGEGSKAPKRPHTF